MMHDSPTQECLDVFMCFTLPCVQCIDTRVALIILSSICWGPPPPHPKAPSAQFYCGGGVASHTEKPPPRPPPMMQIASFLRPPAKGQKGCISCNGRSLIEREAWLRT